MTLSPEQLLAKAKVIRFYKGDHCWIWVYSCWAESRKEFWKRLRKGQTAKFRNGMMVWIDEDINFDLDTKEYTWHEDGNRIRVSEFLLKEYPSGQVVRRKLRELWRRFDKAFE